MANTKRLIAVMILFRFFIVVISVTKVSPASSHHSDSEDKILRGSHRFHWRVSELSTRRSRRKLLSFTSMSLDISRASPFVSAIATGT